METSSGDPIKMPSEIFGSPESQTANDIPRRDSLSEAENVNRLLDEQLKRMKATLAAGQQRQKRKFFNTMLKGEQLKIIKIPNLTFCDLIKDPNVTQSATLAKNSSGSQRTINPYLKSILSLYFGN